MGAALINTAVAYRKNLWAQLPTYFEIWCEKDAIVSILKEPADKFGVLVFPLKGFASLSSLYNAANTFRAQQLLGKEVQIYFFGDYDPSGLCIDRSAKAVLHNDFGLDIHFERITILQEHISRYELPTRPTKKSDSRAAAFDDESVEIDALPPSILRSLVQRCITQHIDQKEWEKLCQIEQIERETFLDAMQDFPKKVDARDIAAILRASAKDLDLC